MSYTCKSCGWSGVVNGKPRCLACYARRAKEWREKNPEKRRAQKSRYDKKYRATRPDEYKAKRRRNRKKATMRAAWKRRWDWLRSGDVTKSQLLRIAESCGRKCFYCGSQVKTRDNPKDPRGFDHVVSRSRGGKHTAANIVVCCGGCNSKKS